MNKILLIISLACVAVGGCRLAETQSAGVGEYGALILTLAPTDMVARTILPPLDMETTYYNVHGEGPGAATFDRSGVTGTSLVDNSLLAGAWVFNADAFNAANVLIGSGGAAVAVVAGQTAQARLTVTPLQGTGILEIVVTWPSGAVSNPGVTGTLEPVGGTSASIPLVYGTDSASCLYPALDVGYYSMTLRLSDGAVLKWGRFEAVRVLKGQTTQATFTLTAEDLNTGGAEIIIAPDMQDPIAVTLSGQQSPLTPGSDMTVAASTSGAPVDSYQWYLDGQSLVGKTSASITIGSSLPEGPHTLDLRVTRGNVLSSGSCSFVVGTPPAPVAITGVSDGGVYDASVVPTWVTASGTVDHAVLSTDSAIVTGYQKSDTISIGSTTSASTTQAHISTLTVTTTKISCGLTAVSRVQFMQISRLSAQIVQTNATETGTALDVYFIGGSDVFRTSRTPLYVIWVEAPNGSFVQDLFVANVAGTNRVRYSPAGGWLPKPSAAPYWAHKAAIQDPYAGRGRNTVGMYLALPTIDGGPIPADLDAVTGATPLGDPVGAESDYVVRTARKADGLSTFRVLLETNSGRDANTYYNYPEVSDDLTPEYWAWDSGQPSLVYGADINPQGPDRFFVMNLLGAGHYSGSDGALHDASHHTTALDIAAKVIVHVK